MKNNRMKQIQNYSKVMKFKRENGEIQEVVLSQQSQPGSEMKQQRSKVDEDAPKNEDFEDPFQDEYQDEEAWISDNSQSDSEQGPEAESGTMISEQMQDQKSNAKVVKQQPTQEEIMVQTMGKKGKNEVFLGNNKSLQKGQVLDFDNSAYEMLHRLNNQWPSLSIDFVCRSSPFDTEPLVCQEIKKYPLEVYTVQGSSNNGKDNSIYMTRWSKLHKTKYDDDAEHEESDDQGNDDEDAQVTVQQIETTYSVNRIRTLNNSPVVAFWNEAGEIHIMDLADKMEKLMSGIGSKKRQTCKEIVMHSAAEGFGLCWNPQSIGQLVTGNNLGQVEVFTNNQNFTSWTKTALFEYHKGSVEDIVFSPTEKDVFATCSSDGTLQIVDMKTPNYKKANLKINAHSKDVNVCDWNKVASHLIVTGSDDATVKIWDLRMIKQNSKHAEQLLCFSFHNEPITSIKFQPNDQSVLAVASEDNRLSIWDMSAENEEFDPQVPNELMFLHQGQQQIKQICFHPIYHEMIISSASDGINIFKPAFQMPEEGDENCDEDLKKPPIKEQDLDAYLGRMSLE